MAVGALSDQFSTRIEDPVFVVCSARSGSTLLRFILDAHPFLACPPETNIPGLCAQLATVWSLIEGAPLSPERGEEPPEIPDAAVKGIRQTMDLIIGTYLDRRNSVRYCDKSLGSARFVDLLTRVYPKAKFLCLYRHPMDVIASGIEACPWGLGGYGFDPYIASSPNNVVLALARFWADNAAAILAVEDRYPDSCFSVRYEDLVTAPELIAERIFSFLGVPSAPGVTTRCFDTSRERCGPADYKIWRTSHVKTESVGRGWDIPASYIPQAVLDQVNAVAEKLGYLQVDGSWGMAGSPPDLRVAADVAEADASAGQAQGPGPVRERLDQMLAGLDADFARRWGQCAAEAFGVVVAARGGDRAGERWRVDLGYGAITALEHDDESTAWDVIGSTRSWNDVLSGASNISVALRRNELRYCDAGDVPHDVAERRIDMLVALLGITSWSAPGLAAPENDPAAAAKPSQLTA